MRAIHSAAPVSQGITVAIRQGTGVIDMVVIKWFAQDGQGHDRHDQGRASGDGRFMGLGRLQRERSGAIRFYQADIIFDGCENPVDVIGVESKDFVRAHSVVEEQKTFRFQQRDMCDGSR